MSRRFARAMASDHMVGSDCPDRVEAWEDPEISRYSGLANAWQQRGRTPSEYRVGDDPSERLSVRGGTADAAEDAASLVRTTQAPTLSWPQDLEQTDVTAVSLLAA
jgi:hypothetical protein